MKVKRFNVVELKDGNRAIILDINKDKYLAEIVNNKGITINKKMITDNDISKIIYDKNKRTKDLVL